MIKPEDRFAPVRTNVARRISGVRANLHEYECIKCRKPFISDPSSMRRSCCTGKCRSCSTKTHGLRKDARYVIWNNIVNRCTNPSNNGFKNYGARGISVCKEWETFDGFMGWEKFNQYLPGLEIDRIDNNSGYSPQNCRWVTRQENAQNTRRTKLNPQSVIEIRSLYKRGFSKVEIAKQFGVGPTIVHGILRGKKWSNIKGECLS
jgi:hypothetical protein